MIGCTLKWSLLNFKQAVLAANAVAALCGSAQSGLCGFVCVCVCVCVCECVAAAHSLVLLLVGPSLLRHRAGQVEKELAWKCLRLPPPPTSPSLPFCAREYE